MRKIRTSKVIKRFGSWVVTTYGIECTTSPYPIEISRLNEHDWIKHMSEKNWVHVGDFSRALNFAIQWNRQRLRLRRQPPAINHPSFK
jgi:hypothetical protein